jgi:hypothetical protein
LATLGNPDDSSHHLFIVRIWTDPAQSPPALTRGLIEHIPTGERRYFLELGEIQAFVSSRLSTQSRPRGIQDDAPSSAQ